MKRFSLLLTMMLSAFSLFAQTTYYRADKSGAVFNQIGVSRIDEFEYVLSVEDLDNAVIRQLFENQKEIRRWERIYEDRKARPGQWQETELVGAKKLSTSYFENFRLVKEEIYFENRVYDCQNS